MFEGIFWSRSVDTASSADAGCISTPVSCVPVQSFWRAPSSTKRSAAATKKPASPQEGSRTRSETDLTAQVAMNELNADGVKYAPRPFFSMAISAGVGVEIWPSPRIVLSPAGSFCSDGVHERLILSRRQASPLVPAPPRQGVFRHRGVPL
jgi:hypothetical protein